MSVRIAIVDDDMCDATDLFNTLKANIESVDISIFESVFDANSMTKVDFMVVDISAVCPTMLNIHNAWSPIASFAANHPGCMIIISSAIPMDAAIEIQNEVKQAIPEVLIDTVDLARGDVYQRVADKINSSLKKA